MLVKVLKSGLYGRMGNIRLSEGDVLSSSEIGDISYVEDCIATGFFEYREPSEEEAEIVDGSENTEAVLTGLREVLLVNKPLITSSAAALAVNHDVDLTLLEGSGLNGKITINDVRRYLKSAND